MASVVDDDNNNRETTNRREGRWWDRGLKRLFIRQQTPWRDPLASSRQKSAGWVLQGLFKSYALVFSYFKILYSLEENYMFTTCRPVISWRAVLVLILK